MGTNLHFVVAAHLWNENKQLKWVGQLGICWKIDGAGSVTATRMLWVTLMWPLAVCL